MYHLLGSLASPHYPTTLYPQRHASVGVYLVPMQPPSTSCFSVDQVNDSRLEFELDSRRFDDLARKASNLVPTNGLSCSRVGERPPKSSLMDAATSELDLVDDADDGCALWQHPPG
jgi:hypothetical protein